MERLPEIDGRDAGAAGETSRAAAAAGETSRAAAAASGGAAAAAARSPRERFLAACRGAPALPVPVWLMRQAGRYLPEYREVRRQADFLTVCKTPELAAEVTLQPLRRFPLDAAILFSDIMVPVEPMGLRLDFDPGPVIDPALRRRADIIRLRVPEAGPDGPVGLEFAIAAVRRIRAAIGPERALLGFAGAPVTLATYMCEGGGAREFTHFKALLHADPGTTHLLLEKLARVVADFLRAQLAAGCDAVQVFDTWGGLLDPYDFEEFVLPHLRAIAGALRDTGAPLIYFCRDAGAVLERLTATGASAFGLDWRVDLARARRTLAACGLQGNLDPQLLLGDPARMIERARRILEAGGAHGHIFNLGHGVSKETPPEHVARLVEAVRAWRPDGAQDEST